MTATKTMNEFDLLCKQNKTVDEIKLPTWNKIIEILDLSPDNDWENIGKKQKKFFCCCCFSLLIQSKKGSLLIFFSYCFCFCFPARYFPKYFTQFDIARIKNESSPSQAVLEVLRNNLVPITRLYKCFVDFQLIQACNYLEKDCEHCALF